MIITKYVWAFDDGSFFVMPKSSWKVDAKLNNKTTKINEATMYSEPMDVPPYAGLRGKWVKVNIGYSIVPSIKDLRTVMLEQLGTGSKAIIDTSEYCVDVVDLTLGELCSDGYPIFELGDNKYVIHCKQENDNDANS